MTLHPAAQDDESLLATFAQTRDEELRGMLAERYLPLARSIARRYARTEHVVSQPCMGSPDGADAVREHEHDLLDLVTSGYLERLGFDYHAASAASTFREPSKVVGAYLP